MLAAAAVPNYDIMSKQYPLRPLDKVVYDLDTAQWSCRETLSSNMLSPYSIPPLYAQLPEEKLQGAFKPIIENARAFRDSAKISRASLDIICTKEISADPDHWTLYQVASFACLTYTTRH